MKGFMNNLVAGKDKFSLLISKLERLEAFTEAIYESREALQKQIDSIRFWFMCFKFLLMMGLKNMRLVVDCLL
jgi:hypothetical protein